MMRSQSINILASWDLYNVSGPHYNTWLGKIYSQSLHFWDHWNIDSKGVYHKDYNSKWYDFYEALHTSLSTGEKIVNWLRPNGSGSSCQIWMRSQPISGYDQYHVSGPHYANYPGKIYTQSLHYWRHLNTYTKGYYEKDPSNGWAHFYEALHNSTSIGEKIVNLIRLGRGGKTEQIWEII